MVRYTLMLFLFVVCCCGCCLFVYLSGGRRGLFIFLFVCCWLFFVCLFRKNKISTFEKYGSHNLFGIDKICN